ncbi:MAG: hypothetical protein IKT42_00220 [Clostridia bacterium]|nr:hypothetical protein [Clostridia bacterium]
MKNVKKIVLLFGLLLLMVFALSGCGANVSGSMTIDKNFAGTREVIVAIDSDDLSSVTGGMTGLENVIKSSIPSQMSYKIEGTTITFSISFANITEYREKVTAIIAAGVTESEKTDGDYITPVVNYERNESYFKKGIMLEENFNNMDLIDWYREALRTANIISESESNWYETGKLNVTLEGSDYSFSSNVDIDEQENTCLSNCNVTTKLLVDGTFEREIVFAANDSDVKALAEKGCELATYFKEFAKDGVTFAAETDDDGNGTYTFTIKADTAEDLLKKTNVIMQNENSKFTVTTTLDEEKLGIAHVAIDEVIDASFYLDYESDNDVTHTIYVYNNAEKVIATYGEKETRCHENEDGSVWYYPNKNTEYHFEFDWQIEFEKVNFSVTPIGEGEIEVAFDCEFADVLPEDMKKSAIDRIKGFLESTECEETDNGVKFSFSGDVATVTLQINKVVQNASGYEGEEAQQYFCVDHIAEFDTYSLFTAGQCCDISYDFTALFGDVKLYVDQTEGFMSSKYYEGVALDDEGEYYIEASGNLAVYTKDLAWMSVIITAISLILLIFGVIFALKNLSELKSFIASLKEKKAAKAAALATAQPEVTQPQEPTPAETPVVAPAPQVPVVEQAPVAPQAEPADDAVAANDDEEEDIL